MITAQELKQLVSKSWQDVEQKNNGRGESEQTLRIREHVEVLEHAFISTDVAQALKISLPSVQLILTRMYQEGTLAKVGFRKSAKRRSPGGVSTLWKVVG